MVRGPSRCAVPVAGSFMDYTMPRADDLPDIVSLLHPVRCEVAGGLSTTR